jgi:hypothetical protein
MIVRGITRILMVRTNDRTVIIYAPRRAKKPRNLNRNVRTEIVPPPKKRARESAGQYRIRQPTRPPGRSRSSQGVDIVRVGVPENVNALFSQMESFVGP